MEILVLWALFGLAGAVILNRFNKAGIGCLLGILLGPIGLIIAWVMRSNAQADEERKRHQEQVAALARANQETGRSERVERECPHCAEPILARANVCKHCGRDVEPLQA